MAGPGRPLVLAVDDEPPILSSLARLLAFEDVDVEVAGGAEEALAALRRREVAVVVTDQHMPGILGVELLCLVRELSPATSRVLLSGHIDVELLRSAVNGGEVYRFVAKPWDDDELLVAVRQGIEHWRLLRQNRDLQTETEHRTRTLESLIADRDRALAAHQRLAGLSLAVLDRLPLLVLAVDPAGLVVVANRLAREAFPGLEAGAPAPAGLGADGAADTRLGRFRCQRQELGEGAWALTGWPEPAAHEEP